MLVKPYRAFIFDTYQILIRLNKMQNFLKNNGFNNKNAKEAMCLFSDMNSDNSLKIKELLKLYFADLSFKAKESKTICCSSDIIESCFSRYKRIVKGNKSVGISDLSLCIAAMMGISDLEKTAKAMETSTMKQVKDWKAENVSKTLFAEKIEINKKVTEDIL